MTLQQLDEAIHLAETHGLSLVLLIAIVILWFVPWVKRMQKKEDAATSYQEVDSIPELMEYEKELVGLLTEAGTILNIPWVMLWQFHNGVTTAAGIPFLKISVTQAYAKTEYASRQEVYQSIPLSVFIDAITQVKEHGWLRVDRTSPYPSAVNSFKAYGVDSGYYFRVNDARGRMVGTLAFTSDTPLLLTPDQIKELKGYSSRVSMVLEKMSTVVTPMRAHRRETDRR